MFLIVPHVGKSHLTYRTVTSIPDAHKVILIDGSYVRDMSTYASNNPKQVIYRHTEGVPFCLAKNWNLGSELVPRSEPWWMFCASDIEFQETSWRRIATMEKNWPDAGIIKDQQTNWNTWLIRRWAYDLLKPFDERYKPCGGEDDDIVMKCQMAGIKIKEGMFCLNHCEGGHATRIDIGDEYRGTGWDERRDNIAVFRRKWGCIPSKGRDPKYKAAITETHLISRRREPPKKFTIPTVRPEYPEDQHIDWPDPLKINLGCGIKPMKGYVNVDLQSKCADFLMDITTKDPWPWEPNSAECVESYHVLEHLTAEDGKRVVRRAFETLKPGGRIVIECPDLERICERYPKSRRAARWGMYGMGRWGEHQQHLYGYCGPTLALLFKETGFEGIDYGPGTDYHEKLGPCVRAEGVKP